MRNRKMMLQVLLAMALVLSLVVPASVVGASGAGLLPDDQPVGYSVADSSAAALSTALNTPEGNVNPMVAASSSHTVGLKSDGTVVAVGSNSGGQCDVNGWTDIVQVAAGAAHTVGLKSDGTVVAVGFNDDGRCDVDGWMDIVQVGAGSSHTVGLKSDGTVVAVGDNSHGECDVGGWTDIIQVAAGWGHTVGLKSDGTVVAVGDNYNGQCDVGGWTDIVQVTAGWNHTVGLKSDGTVVAVGWDKYGQCDVSGWTDIVQVAAGNAHTVGLKSDGTVVAAGPEGAYQWPAYGQCAVGGWTDITQVAAGVYHTVGLKSDGTVVAVGSNEEGQREVNSWNLLLAVPASEWLLTISSSGGSVTTPGEGTFTYGPGTVVDLIAEPDEGHSFVQWTGDVDSIADVGNASTTIIMDGDHAIRANFMPVEVTELSVRVSPSTGPPGTTVDVVVFNLERISGSYGQFRLIFYFNDVSIHEMPLTRSLSSATFRGVRIPKIWPGEYTFKVLHENFNITGTAKFTVLPATRPPEGGIIAGDWIEYEYALQPAGHTGPEWLKLEFISVRGTSASVNVTLGMSDGQELRDTVPVDLGEGGGEAFGLAGFAVPPNLTAGDAVNISGYGNATIEGETTRTYAGARREVVYASFSQDEVQIAYYWDKETGVMLEASKTQEDVTTTGKVTETNMWEASTVRKLWWLWVILGLVVAGLVILLVRRKGAARTEGG